MIAVTPMRLAHRAEWLQLTTRAVAVSYVVLLLVAYGRWIPRWIDFRLSQASATVSLLADGGPYVALTWVATLAALVSAAVWIALGVLIEWRRSRDLFGNMLFIGFVAVGVIVATDVDVVMPMQRTDSWPQFQMPLIFLANAISVPWIYAFPDGRVVPRWAVLPAAIWVGWSVARIITPAADQASLGTPAVLLNLVLVTSPVAFFIFRYFWRSDDVERVQLKWLLIGGVFYLLAYIVTIPVPLFVPELQEAGPAFVYHSASRAWLSLSLIVVALALTAAIMRYRLLDVDLVIRRAVVYAAVAAILAGIFAALATAVQTVLVDLTGQRSGLATGIIALVVAAGFSPIRSWVRPLADRFLPPRELLAVLFVDIVGSTERIAELGDERWVALLAAYRHAVRQALRSFGGREVDTAGDGFFATFEVPKRAVQCAAAIRTVVSRIGLETRIGLHVGECEMRGEKVSGLTVHIGARLMALAQPDQIVVSRTVRNLLEDAGMRFEARGEQQLKGVPGLWQLYAFST